MQVLIRKSTIIEIENAKDIAEILKEYGTESAIKGLPPPCAKFEMYRQLENIGIMHVLGAFHDESLIGFITILSSVLPHYGTTVTVSESFFVLKKYRKTGAGLKLLKAAENYSREIKACGILVTAPMGGNLIEVLPHSGYIETNRVFFKEIYNEERRADFQSAAIDERKINR